MKNMLIVLYCLLVCLNCTSRDLSPPFRPSESVPSSDLHTVLLAQYQGQYDGLTGTLTLVPVERRVGQALSLSSIPATSAGTTSPPNPTSNTVQLRQLAVRSVDSACNTMATAAGETIPAMFTGVCVPIEMRSGFVSQEVIRAHVQVTTLTNNHAGALITYVKTPSDADFNLDNTLGLWGYGRLAPAGTSGNLDRIARNWYFHLPSESGTTSSFRFVVDVRGVVVSPIERPTLGGCDVSTNVPTIGTHIHMSADGDAVVFVTSTVSCRAGGGQRQVYHYRFSTNTLTLVSHAASGAGTGSDGVNDNPVVSATGLLVAWESTSTDLLPMGLDAHGYSDSNSSNRDIFVRDLQTDAIYVMSVDDSTLDTTPSNSRHPWIAADGSFVVFDTDAVLDASDVNSVADVYMRDVAGAITYMITPGSASRTADALYPTVANNGFFVTFESTDNTLVMGDTNGKSDVFIVDTNTNGIQCLSLTSTQTFANDDATRPFISANGTHVAFESTATDMMGASTTAGRKHIYLVQVDGQNLIRVSGLFMGSEANGPSELPSVTNEGRFVLFNSAASNIHPWDSNTDWNVYMVDTRTTDARRQPAFVIDTSVTNSLANATTAQGLRPAINIQGDYGLFASSASNLASGSSNLYRAPLR